MYQGVRNVSFFGKFCELNKLFIPMEIDSMSFLDLCSSLKSENDKLLCLFERLFLTIRLLLVYPVIILLVQNSHNLSRDYLTLYLSKLFFGA